MDTRKQEFKLIMGLGNPDKKYKNTYHNVGQLFIDFLQKNYAPYPMPHTLKTTAYMNESGKFVSKALKKNNTKPKQLLIIHDDSDIYLGNYKLSYGRGSAGHNGVESIIQALKTKNFWRLRIGVRPKEKIGVARQKAEKFVLKNIGAASKKILEETFKKIKAEIL